MRTPAEYRDDVKNYCGLCRDAYEEKIDKLERENIGLQDTLTDMQDEIERISTERDEAKERYAALVEVVGTRTDQAKPLGQVVGPDPRD
jgi:predicted RNase H-like nuclease (RuvC/YqgF family)